MGSTSSLVFAGAEILYPPDAIMEVVPVEGAPPGPLDPAPDGAPGVPDDGDAAPADEAPPPPPPAPGQGFGPRHMGRRPQGSHTPCPCCYYNRSTIVPGTGEYSPGWRLFGGYWSWWHKGAPHALASFDNPELGCNDPTVPRCDCCYYNYMEGVPPGPGWYVGEWSPGDGSWTWQWCDDGAPHAPGPNGGGDWSQVADDARFMQWYTLADDGSYVPRRLIDYPALVGFRDQPLDQVTRLPPPPAPGSLDFSADELREAQIELDWLRFLARNETELEEEAPAEMEDDLDSSSTRSEYWSRHRAGSI